MSKTSPVILQKIALILLLACAPAPLSLFAQATIAPPVMEAMAESPEQAQEVLLLLADKVDCRALGEAFQRSRTDLAERASTTINALQAKAVATQPAVLTKLRRLPGVDQAGIQAYWVINAIYCRADAAALETISSWPEIALIEPDFKAVRIDGHTEAAPAPPVPDGKEPGLEAINAPAMWALGYTGYGRKALIMDSRQELDHPALRNGFWGNYVPFDQAFSGLESNPGYCSDHGSHVAGIAIGLDRATNDTIGVAFNANWMAGPIAFDECSFLSGITRSTIATFQWALDPDDNPSTTDDMPDAINCSWSDPPNYNCSNAGADLLAAVEATGIATIWAIGNEGPDAGSVGSAQAIAFDLVSSFTVGALNGDNIAGFSSRGPTSCVSPGGAISIKPEVSAPGVNIRSSVPEGDYGVRQGTSMAAPHVTGAVLLLKEAFPYLPGRDLKMALYMTAIDLGPNGEDNAYGRGRIDVFAAYQYLIDEGNDPVLPASTAHDAVILAARTERDVFCQGELTTEITFENNGDENLTSLQIAYGLDPDNLAVTDWSGNLAFDQQASTVLPAIEVEGEGPLDLIVELRQPNGQDDSRPLNNSLRRRLASVDLDYVPGAVQTGFPQPACNGARVPLFSDLQVDADQRIEWYDEFTGGQPLGEGPVFVTDPIDGPQNYYVDLITINQAGKPGIEEGNSDIGDLGAGLRFDAFQPFRLKSVKVYAEETGVRIIRLVDPDGSSLDQAVANISTTGEQRLELNFEVPARNNLTLKLINGKSLRHSTTGVSFPYAIDDLVRIKRSVDSPNPVGDFLYYYYFYDWEINRSHPCGRTVVPVTSSGGSAPAATISVEAESIFLSQGGLVDFSAGGSGVVSWEWDFGNGTGSTAQNPEAQYTAPGVYPVTLVVTSGNGCTSADQVYITVIDDVTATGEATTAPVTLQLFPNPVKQQLQLRFSEAPAGRGNLLLVDALGRPVQSQAGLLFRQDMTLPTAELPAGVYFLVLTTEEGRRWTRRFVKQE